MEYRSQKAIGLIFALLASSLPAAELTYQVRHDRLWRDRTGSVTLDEEGVVYRPAEEPERRWSYTDIQQLWLGEDRLVILTYQDRSRWLLGVDKEFDFKFLPGQDTKPAYAMLRRHLDRRFVAALPEQGIEPLWELPVKLHGTLRGSEGVLKVGADRIVYETARKDDSRTWRLEDIENVSTSDPLQLTITTYERARTHYGSRKDFNFQLKRPLDDARFNDLWRRLNTRHEPDVLALDTPGPSLVGE
jgi:hypothetical protein